MSSHSKSSSAAAQTEIPSQTEPQLAPVLLPPSPSLPPEHHANHRKKSTAGLVEQKSLWNAAIIRQALVDSFRKLNPPSMIKNPVMFVVEVGSALTTLLLIDNTFHHREGFGFNLQITLWLWFTVLFANFAEAMAEGRGKAQADTLRKAKGETIAQRYTASGALQQIASGELRAGDVIYIPAGHYIAGDGEVIEGVASVDESAITGESAPVIREAGGEIDRLSREEPKSFQTGSRCESRRTPERLSWIV